MELQIVWFCIVAFMFVGYFVLDGFDFGVGMALPFIGHDDVDRRVIINTIGPIWDFNETWVIVAGASLFAAFPEWYATVFSGFYLPLLLILVALILRGVSFEYRHQGKGKAWTNRFDTFIVIGSVVPALLWGVAFANIVQGLPLDEGFNFTGTVFDLLNPYALLGGLTTLALFFYHGLVYLTRKTDGALRERAQRLAVRVGVAVAVLAIAFLGWTVVASGFRTVTLVVALVAVVAFVGSWLCNLAGRDAPAFGLGATTVAAAVVTLFSALYPNLMPNTADPSASLTIWNGSSSDYTLRIMTWAALITLPFVLAYQAWSLWVFRKRIRRDHIISPHEDEDAPGVGAAAAV